MSELKASLSNVEIPPPRGRFHKIIATLVFLNLVAAAIVIGIYGVEQSSVSPWLQDDAFISFRYAQNLAQGNGLVYNQGERVEGFSNLLLTLTLTAGIESLGVPPEILSLRIGLLALVATIASMIITLVAVFSESPTIDRAFSAGCAGCSALALLAYNDSLVKHSSGGLETALFYCLVLLVTVFTSRMISRTSIISALLSVAFLVAIMLCRPEGILVGLSVQALAFILLIRRKCGSLRLPLFSSGSMLLAFLCLTAWRLYYFGDWIPNTVRVRLDPDYLFAIKYLRDFGRCYPAFVLSGIICLYATAILYSRRTGDLDFVTSLQFLSSGTALLYTAFVLLAGGDFIEYRLMTHIMPLAALGASLTIVLVWNHNRLVALGLFTLLATTAAIPRRNLNSAGGHSIEALKNAAEQWSQAGRVLSRLPNDTRIASVAAGAMAYYSKLYFVDMHGLTDQEIARMSALKKRAPAHQRQASLQMLRERRVNLELLLMPECECAVGCVSLAQPFFLFIAKDPQEKSCLPARYLTPSESIDKMIGFRQSQCGARDAYVRLINPFRSHQPQACVDPIP